MSNSIPENVMTSVCYRNFLIDNSQFRERDRTKVLEIRNKISNVLSKVKKNRERTTNSDIKKHSSSIIGWNYK